MKVTKYGSNAPKNNISCPVCGCEYLMELLPDVKFKHSFFSPTRVLEKRKFLCRDCNSEFELDYEEK